MHRCVAHPTEFKKNLFLRSFHFPRSLLHWQRQNPTVQFSTTLKTSETRLIELNDIGKSRFGDYTNSVFHYNKKLGYDVESKFKNEFVQAPMSSKKEVSEYLLYLTNSRRKPRSSDSFISPEKKIIALLLIS